MRRRSGEREDDDEIVKESSGTGTFSISSPSAPPFFLFELTGVAFAFQIFSKKKKDSPFSFSFSFFFFFFSIEIRSENTKNESNPCTLTEKD